MPAGELYKKSALFRYSVEYCKKNFDQVFVISPKYGLIPIEAEVEPYEMSLWNIQRNEFKKWLSKVADQIKESISKDSELYFFAGRRYRKLIPFLTGYLCHMPLEGMGIGKQLKFFKERI